MFPKHVFSTFTASPRILSSSGCVYQSEFLICECISEGFPLPNISWPLLKSSTKYFLMNCTSDHLVKSTMIVSQKDAKHRTPECVIQNSLSKTIQILNISTKPQLGKYSQMNYLFLFQLNYCQHKSNPLKVFLSPVEQSVCSDQMSFFTPQENVFISKGSKNTRKCSQLK